jgi:hypothetical protein
MGILSGLCMLMKCYFRDSDTKVGALSITGYIAMVVMVVHKWLYLSQYSATPKPSSSAGYVTHFMCPLLWGWIAPKILCPAYVADLLKSYAFVD